MHYHSAIERLFRPLRIHARHAQSQKKKTKNNEILVYCSGMSERQTWNDTQNRFYNNTNNQAENFDVHSARRPSNFSLMYQLVVVAPSFVLPPFFFVVIDEGTTTIDASCLLSYFLANITPGIGRFFAVLLWRVEAASRVVFWVVRRISVPFPWIDAMCLHVRRAILIFWNRHPAQVQE